MMFHCASFCTNKMTISIRNKLNLAIQSIFKYFQNTWMSYLGTKLYNSQSIGEERFENLKIFLVS